LGSGELLFQVMGGGLLILPSKGGSAFTHMCLIQGLTCDSHSGGVLSRGCGIVLLHLSGGDLLLVIGEVGGATRHSR
jgi:hypothetical protein